MKTTKKYRENLGNISSCMAKIHRLLLENEIEIYEKKQGHAMSPNARLQLLLNDPEFAWMRAMSQLMAFVDEIYFQKEPIKEDQVIAAQKGVESLLIQANESEFYKKYRSLFGIIPDLMIEHAHLKMALKQMEIKDN